jgi:elongation factor P
MIEAAQLRKGTVVEIDGELYRVFDFQHQKIGRGGANVKTKLRNLVSGSMLDRTFNSDERLQDVRLESRRVQYLYTDGDLYHFMDMETYEQPVLSAAAVAEVRPYLVENMELQLSLHNGQAVEIDLPTTVDLEVADTAPGYKGDTASGGGKPARLANGLTVNVPFFVENGDLVRVDTRTNAYVTRVREK